MYPSVTQLLTVILAAQFPAPIRVCTDLPADLEQVLPAIQVARFGGAAKVLTMDQAMIDIDVWHSSLDAVETLASQVAAWLHTYLPGHSATGSSGTGTFAKAHMQTGMTRRPSGNIDVYRMGSAWTLSVHSY